MLLYRTDYDDSVREICAATSRKNESDGRDQALSKIEIKSRQGSLIETVVFERTIARLSAWLFRCVSVRSQTSCLEVEVGQLSKISTDLALLGHHVTSGLLFTSDNTNVRV